MRWLNLMFWVWGLYPVHPVHPCKLGFLMLDSETKRRIDTARDILVGKVPDPKSQVEQITIALIYKFMDDMDAASEELGGTRRFFAGEFARFGWPKLMRSGLGGHEMLGLYAEAIDRMTENPGIPYSSGTSSTTPISPIATRRRSELSLRSSTSSPTTTASGSATPSNTCSRSSDHRATPGSSGPHAISSTSSLRSLTRRRAKPSWTRPAAPPGF